MTPSRLLTYAAALGLAAGIGAVAPAPAAVAAQSQTIQFTSQAPQGQDWFTTQSFIGYQYVARATASSGLPVQYSIAPESAGVCSIVPALPGDQSAASGAPIRFDHAGICTVQADQPGDSSYLPAPRVTQSFRIEKVRTWIEQVRGKRGLPGHTARFSALLKTWQFIDSHTVSPLPFPGQVVTFSVAGRVVCSGTTGSNGVATCSGTLLKNELTRMRFTATYAGTNDYQSVSGSAFFAWG